MARTCTPTIEIDGLHKRFGARLALNGLDLSVRPGTVVALIGPNGSGKTTTVRILSTLVRPDAGTARICGHDVGREPQAVRSHIGVTGQFSAVDDLLTGRENLAVMADLHHLGREERRRRSDELLDRFELGDAADRAALGYSGGMRRRLDLAMTLMGRPSVVFLDEPTTGLDPRGRRVLWQAVRDMAAAGMTLLLTTQYLEEADRLADEVALIDHGRVVAFGSPEELKSRTAGGHVRLSFATAAERSRARAAFPDAVESDGTMAAIRWVIDQAESHGLAVQSVSAQPAELDDVFLALTR
jgi:ABC-2 type transport system ATP-binding protein